MGRRVSDCRDRVKVVLNRFIIERVTLGTALVGTLLYFSLYERRNSHLLYTLLAVRFVLRPRGRFLTRVAFYITAAVLSVALICIFEGDGGKFFICRVVIFFEMLIGLCLRIYNNNGFYKTCFFPPFLHSWISFLTKSKF